ncbi:hypothetical protein DFH07DRAFT_988068 [Mycena maculata]|uniref:Uncharacterized protein n=1 Tax=Mycena maculata TaxID=230809 RepID=A0AAD7I4C9_9AGAR|nr:hypothetical protein DFH07DRAFT_988068 [Mycena maculata]
MEDPSQSPDRRQPAAPTTVVQLPRTLERQWPSSDLAARVTLDALAPDLAALPLPFIRMQLVLCARQMLAGLQALALPSTISHRHLRSTLTVPMPREQGGLQPLYPTHVLAVSPPSTNAPSPDAPVALIPMHGVVLAANCTAPLLLLAPTVTDPASAPGTLVLPVCPVTLPSLHAFLIVRAFMYTHRVDALLNALLPLPVRLTHAAVHAALASAEDRVRIAAHLTGAHPGIRHLLLYAGRVRELWHTVCWLGMDHGRLWDAINLAWELVILALNLAAGTHEREQG